MTKTFRYKIHTSEVSKYKAKKAEADGITFHSTKERNYYLRLKDMQARGEINFFLMQVPFRLPGGIKYLLDFMIFHPSGTIEFIDVKGYLTQTAKIKIKQVVELYKIDIKLV